MIGRKREADKMIVMNVEAEVTVVIKRVLEIKDNWSKMIIRSNKSVAII